MFFGWVGGVALAPARSCSRCLKTFLIVGAGLALGPLLGSTGRKTEKLDFHTKKQYFAPYGDSGRFDVTEWSGNVSRIEIDPVLPTFCLTE